ncbi:hypothetical protein BV22DRAFT_926886 [Leucogyrophana mollusca]|uniref:Uncharacterized protein n=1 Tax=Leucogyrophana mollusca TaxID=85980 RepID=A0ACB8AXC1_9AGAM|nr:hypothetical protein BV22DRAFT_926886 [Leucogyrophana mollusca]
MENSEKEGGGTTRPRPSALGPLVISSTGSDSTVTRTAVPVSDAHRISVTSMSCAETTIFDSKQPVPCIRILSNRANSTGLSFRRSPTTLTAAPPSYRRVCSPAHRARWRSSSEWSEASVKDRQMRTVGARCRT